MIQVARGRLSKQIAGDIGIAEATVKVHRSRAMQKMQAGSLPELGAGWPTNSSRYSTRRNAPELHALRDAQLCAADHGQRASLGLSRQGAAICKFRFS